VLVYAALVPLLAPVLVLAVEPPGTASPGWQITDVRTIEVDGEITSMSPDGEWIAGVGEGDTLCVWAIATMAQQCDDTELPIRTLVPLPNISWAPDSSAVAFHLDPIVNDVDSDIYVYDIGLDALTNVTDDHYEGPLPDSPEGVPIDIVPVWSPDGTQLAFVRSVPDLDPDATTIMRVGSRGGEPAVVLRLDDGPYAVRTPMHWLPDDTLLYAQSIDPPDNEIWRVAVEGGKPRLLIPAGTYDFPVIAAAAGEVASIYTFQLAESAGQGTPQFWLANLTDGSTRPVLDLQAGNESIGSPVAPTALSPDGATAFATFAAGADLVFATIETATGDIEVLDRRTANDGVLRVPTQWATNDTVLVFQSENSAMLIALDPT
jgi:Tol biopolymer transport system component